MSIRESERGGEGCGVEEEDVASVGRMDISFDMACRSGGSMSDVLAGGSGDDSESECWLNVPPPERTQVTAE